VTVYTYTAAGRLAERRLPNGVTTQHRYDRAGRLIELTHRNAAGDLLARYAYTLDALGNRIQVQEGALYQIYLPLVLRTGGIVARAGETTANQETTTATARLSSYHYDSLNRLVAADYSTGEHFAYRYDAAGNRLTLTETTPLSGTVISAHTYDAANRLMERHVSDGPGVGFQRTYTYTWSARGQLLAEYTQGIPVRVFNYNGAGQMTEATVFTLTTQFRYNGAGGRVNADVVGHGATHVTLDTGGQRVLAETTPADAVQYLYGGDCLGEYRNGAWLYYLNDGSGYVRQGVDAQGEVVSSWLFDPSGTVLEGPEGPVSHLICGGVYDWSTGLLYQGGGYFDPRLGIWLLLAPLVVVQGWGKQRRKHPWVIVLLLVAGLSGTLAACQQTPTPMPTCIPTNTPTPGPAPEQAFEGYHLILACGLNTDCPSEACSYAGQVPLQSLRDLFVDRGGEYTYLGDQAALSNVAGSTGVYANQIVAEMDAHADSKGVFLVGHSRGATAAIWAASISTPSQLKAIAILDSYLLDDSDKDNIQRCGVGGNYDGGCVSDGKEVASRIPVFMGRSNERDPNILFPQNPDKNYPVGHIALATDNTAANDIIQFFLTYAR
jgi:YD repeat-containing protein